MNWYQQRLKITVRLMVYCFQTQTNIAAFDIAFNIFSEAWPIVFPVNDFPRFVDTKIACQRVVMIPTNELCLNDFRYKQ